MPATRKKRVRRRRRRRKTRHATRRKQKKTRRRRSARRHRRRRTRRRRRRTYRGGAGFWENFGSALKTAGAQIGSGAAAVVKYGRNQGAKLAAGGLELATGGVGTGAINQPRSFSYNPETTKDSGFSMEDVEYIPYTYSTLGSRMAWAWQTAAVQNRHILLNIADFTTKASRAGDLRSAVGAELNDVISASPEDLYDDNLPGKHWISDKPFKDYDFPALYRIVQQPSIDDDEFELDTTPNEQTGISDADYYYVDATPEALTTGRLIPLQPFGSLIWPTWKGYWLERIAGAPAHPYATVGGEMKAGFQAAMKRDPPGKRPSPWRKVERGTVSETTLFIKGAARALFKKAGKEGTRLTMGDGTKDDPWLRAPLTGSGNDLMDEMAGSRYDWNNPVWMEKIFENNIIKQGDYFWCYNTKFPDVPPIVMQRVAANNCDPASKTLQKMGDYCIDVATRNPEEWELYLSAVKTDKLAQEQEHLVDATRAIVAMFQMLTLQAYILLSKGNNPWVTSNAIDSFLSGVFLAWRDPTMSAIIGENTVAAREKAIKEQAANLASIVTNTSPTVDFGTQGPASFSVYNSLLPKEPIAQRISLGNAAVAGFTTAHAESFIRAMLKGANNAGLILDTFGLLGPPTPPDINKRKANPDSWTALDRMKLLPPPEGWDEALPGGSLGTGATGVQTLFFAKTAWSKAQNNTQEHGVLPPTYPPNVPALAKEGNLSSPPWSPAFAQLYSNCTQIPIDKITVRDAERERILKEEGIECTPTSFLKMAMETDYTAQNDAAEDPDDL